MHPIKLITIFFLPIYFVIYFMLLPGDDTFYLPIYLLVILCSYKEMTHFAYQSTC
jgi:hypothetical protein